MSATPGLPARPSLEQLRKQAKDLLRQARGGDEASIARFRAVLTKAIDVDGPHPPILADAQFVVAREYGFSSWTALVRHIEVDAPNGGMILRPLIRPVELRGDRPYELPDGTSTTTQAVFDTFVAARDGDLRRVRELVAQVPGLALVEYNYTPPIHFAVREGHVDLVHFLIERGADLGYRSYPFGDELLTIAEDHEHHEVAALLRERLARWFALGADTSRIIGAAKAGDYARVRAELERDPRLARASDNAGDTALHQAAHHARRDIVDLLLDAGADPDAVRGDGYRPIHCALLPNWIVHFPRPAADAIADKLLQRGARYTLFIATLRGDEAFVRETLRRDASLVNVEDTCHHRPISAAAMRDDVPLARLLLEHGADPTLPEEGAPRGLALWMAVNRRNVELVRLLLEHGADPNGMVDSAGTPTQHAEKVRSPAIRELLHSHGGHEQSADPLRRLLEERDFAALERALRQRPELIDEASWGDGILAGPAHAGDHELIEVLMRIGARVPPVSKWAPYYYFKHEATARFLLEHGMDPNHMNWHRLTLLHHMAAEGELAKARLLVDHGADINAIDEEYRSTPLGVAARRGQADAVKLLLERGADPTLAGAPWATPMAWARKKGHSDIVALLGGPAE